MNPGIDFICLQAAAAQAPAAKSQAPAQPALAPSEASQPTA
jgi:hypothetical protein